MWPLNGQDFCLLVGKNKFDNSFVISERSVSLLLYDRERFSIKSCCLNDC